MRILAAMVATWLSLTAVPLAGIGCRATPAPGAAEADACSTRLDVVKLTEQVFRTFKPVRPTAATQEAVRGRLGQ
jgi:hypothetical protein